MLTIEVDLVGLAPISFNAPVKSEKNTGEMHDAFEERTWRERMHVDNDGHVFIPPMALKNCLSECAKYLSETVPGKGKATYTKHFESGIMVTTPLVLCNGKGTPVRADGVAPNRVYVPSDGKRGGGSRVWKNFPIVPTWRTHASIHVMEPMLIDKPAKVEEYLTHAGQFIGLGTFRPRRNGYFGRFAIENFKVVKG